MSGSIANLFTGRQNHWPESWSSASDSQTHMNTNFHRHRILQFTENLRHMYTHHLQNTFWPTLARFLQSLLHFRWARLTGKKVGLCKGICNRYVTVSRWLVLRVVNHVWWAKDWARSNRLVILLKLSSEVGSFPMFTNEKPQHEKGGITCPGSTLAHSGIPAHVCLAPTSVRWPTTSAFLPSPSPSPFPCTPRAESRWLLKI